MSTDKVLAGRDGEDPVAPGFTRVSIRQLYFAGIWAAIRAGWREGYSAGADRIIVSGCNPNEVARSLEAAREAVVQAAGYARFAADTCRLFLPEADPRHPAAWSDAAVEEKFETQFDAEERTWIFDEFLKPFQAGDRTYELTRALVMRLAAKFGPGLKLNEELYDAIRRARMGQPQLSFDFEAAIDETAYPTTPGELIFVLQWLKARGRPAQLVAPNPGIGGPPGETSARLKELASVARYFHATLSIDSGIGHTESQLGTIARATMGRVNYKVSAELQLELFDVLAEQPEGSYWHALYRRMAARANEFAALGAFGAAGCEASRYRDVRLGDPANGRTDGNLFLVRCIGNVAGSRDVHDPAGDHRFFQEKLDELPADLAAEVRRRNTGYITRVAEHLVG
jgi:hypothetical protein